MAWNTHSKAKAQVRAHFAAMGIVAPGDCAEDFIDRHRESLNINAKGRVQLGARDLGAALLIMPELTADYRVPDTIEVFKSDYEAALERGVKFNLEKMRLIDDSGTNWAAEK